MSNFSEDFADQIDLARERSKEIALAREEMRLANLRAIAEREARADRVGRTAEETRRRLNEELGSVQHDVRVRLAELIGALLEHVEGEGDYS